MKIMDVEKQKQQQSINEKTITIPLKEEAEEEKKQQVVQHRWMWVRRFIFCIIMITLFMQSFAPIYFEEEEQDLFIINHHFAAPPITKTTGGQKSHIVLHTGFPPTKHVSGLPIYPGKAAASAFSPNPEERIGQIDMKHRTIQGGESWWDRLFPNRHVHLVSVQLPVMPLTKDRPAATTASIQAKLSICASKKQQFGLGRPQIPDLDKCIDTIVVHSDDEDGEDEAFGVIEWIPDITIVLQKSKLYWLVVQAAAEAEPFRWVYAQKQQPQQDSSNHLYSTAYQTETGWEFKLEDEPIPSAMVMVQDHHTD